jgi:hypothetical protein
LENGSADQGVVTKSYALKGILSDTATDRMGFVQVLSGGKSRSVKIILQEASK